MVSYIDKLSQKLYDQSQHTGWLGQKINDIVGDDYQKHLVNTMTTGGIPLLNYNQDGRDARAKGESPWHSIGQNGEKSAAILAAIFGGGALAGGGAEGGAAEGGGTAASSGGAMGGSGVLDGASFAPAGEGSGLLLDTSAGGWGTATTGGEVGGAGAAGTNWTGLMGKALKAYGAGSQMGGGSGQSQGGYNASGQPDLSQPAFVYSPQQENKPYSLAPNQLTPDEQAQLQQKQLAMRSGLMAAGGNYGY